MTLLDIRQVDAALYAIALSSSAYNYVFNTIVLKAKHGMIDPWDYELELLREHFHRHPSL
jgi:hypothetical protein